MEKNYKEKLLEFIELKTQKKLTLPDYLDKPMNEAVNKCQKTTINNRLLSELCTEERFFDYLFDQWKLNVEMISDPDLGTKGGSLTIFNILMPLRHEKVENATRVFGEISKACEFKQFDIAMYMYP
jgi:hypothetical protein